MEDKKEKLPSTRIQWYPGHMAKAKREIQENLKLIDVVVEVLDARIPKSCQNPDMKNIINTKKKIILLNKCDLADEVETKKWQEYFKKEGQVSVLVDLNLGRGIEETIKKIEELMKEEIEKNKEKGRSGKVIRVLIIGIPNVRKILFY